MHYGITTEATDFTPGGMLDWRYRVLRKVFFFIPRANPDNERLYPNVQSWALELNDQGWPQREVGLDSTGNPIFCAPDSRNTGFWPDMALKQFDVAELHVISAENFNDLWTRAQADA